MCYVLPIIPQPACGSIVNEIPTHRTWRKPSGGLFTFGGLLNGPRTVSEAGHRVLRRPEHLYHAARHAFGYTYPNFDPIALASAVANSHGWELSEVRFYTGVPDREDDPFWHHFWTNKLAHLGRRGATIYSRSLVCGERSEPTRTQDLAI